MRCLILILLLCSHTVLAEGPAAKEDNRPLLPAVLELKLEPQPNVFDEAGVEKPLQIKNPEAAARFFDEKQLTKLGKQVDFERQLVLVFAWKGSGQDRLSYSVAESFPEQVAFDYKRGLTRDLRSHVKIYVLRSNVNWKAGGK